VCLVFRETAGSILDSSRLRTNASLGDDRDLQILGNPQNVRSEAPSSYEPPAPDCWAHQKYLRDSFAVREIHEDGGSVLTLEYSRLDMEVPREIQVPFNRFSFKNRHAT
jgi:hypothetical protein